MRILVNVFIIVYLLGAWCWRAPDGTFWRTLILPLSTAMEWLGLTQNWSMFTPDPSQVGSDLQVVIRRRSGNAILWEPPRMDALSRWQAFRQFRYRTYSSVIMANWAASARRPLADHLLRKFDLGDDPAVEILFTTVECPVAAPGGTVAAEGPARTVFYTFTPGAGAP